MKNEDKQARLAAALRENLRKRKAGPSSSPAEARDQCPSDEKNKK